MHGLKLWLCDANTLIQKLFAIGLASIYESFTMEASVVRLCDKIKCAPMRLDVRRSCDHALHSMNALANQIGYIYRRFQIPFSKHSSMRKKMSPNKNTDTAAYMVYCGLKQRC